MSRPLPAPREDFIGLDDRVHLAAGGEPPLLRVHRDAFEAFARDKADGFDGYHRHWTVAAEARARLAAMAFAQEGEVALVGNASEAICRIVSSIDWRPVDNVVLPSHDFPSGRFALGMLARKGIDVRFVRPSGWLLDEDALVDACDDRTRLVYLSQVNALTGQHFDIGRIAAGLADAPTVLLVDASHALGVVLVDARLGDFTVGCTYKFALGVHDGYLIWNRDRQPAFEPDGVGWHSATSGDGPTDFALKPDAKRAEYGNVGHLSAYILRESIDYLNGYGIDRIAAHVRALSGDMIDAMTDLGLDVMTPRDPMRRAANAAFAWPDTSGFLKRAAESGVLLWGDNNRIRASAHLFTSRQDVESFVQELPSLIAADAEY